MDSIMCCTQHHHNNYCPEDCGDNLAEENDLLIYYKYKVSTLNCKRISYSDTENHNSAFLNKKIFALLNSFVFSMC